MCRLAAYLGPPAPLSTLLYDAPRSLEVQANAPREQLQGNVNVDGMGIAWWEPEHPRPSGQVSERPRWPAPLRYVSERPPWSDQNLPALAPRLLGRIQLAAVRSATPGMPFSPGAVAPFVRGALAAAHNGRIEAFRERMCRVLLERLPGHLLGALDVLSDSTLLFLHIAAYLEREPGAGLAAAVRGGAGEVARACAEQGAAATLTLAVADGECVAALRAAVGRPTNSLYTLHDGRRWPGAVLLASEPLDDDPAWRPVPAGSLVELTRDGVVTVALPKLETAA